MKIIQVIYALGSGGAEKFVINLSNELVECGHDVIVCMIREDSNSALIFNKQFLRRDVKFHCMNFNRGFSIKKLNAVESFVKSEHPDVVHCHLNVIPYIYRLAIYNREIKFIHTIHSIASKASGHKTQYYLNKYFYSKQTIQPVTISKRCDNSFVDYYHINKAICIDNGCPNVIASELFGEVKLEVESYKQRDNTPVFIHIARCSPLKNQQLLIDAFNLLNNERVDYVLLIIGNGYFEKQNSTLLDKACGKIHFLGEKRNIGDYLLCADAFCLTSIYEGLPISLIEAMSCGLTPICTSVGGIPDVVTDGITGYLANSLSLTDYYLAVKRFLDQTIKKSIVKEAFRSKFSIEACVDKYLKIYSIK